MMLNWFDEPMLHYIPFIPRRSNIFDYMSHWMESVDREMEKVYGAFYDPFFVPVEKEEAVNVTNSTAGAQNVTTNSTKAAAENNTKKVEEKVKEPEYYSLSTSVYSGSDGIQHIVKEEVDSVTGKKRVVETKRIGDKSITIQKTTDKNGKIEEKETRRNIKDDEITKFNEDWDKHINKSNKPKQALPNPSQEKNSTSTNAKVANQENQTQSEL